MAKTRQRKAPFFNTIAKYLGVNPKDLLLHSIQPGKVTLVGPEPITNDPRFQVPNIARNCVTFVLRTDPVWEVCRALTAESSEIKSELPALIADGAWADVIVAVERLQGLEILIGAYCTPRERVIEFCWPREGFFDPFADPDYGKLPPRPPSPYLRFGGPIPGT